MQPQKKTPAQTLSRKFWEIVREQIWATASEYRYPTQFTA